MNRLRCHSGAPRAGVGALVIIVCVLLMAVAVMGVSQSFFSSHLVDKAQRSSFGNVAMALAESAAQEALLGVEWQANAPDGGLYQLFRRVTAGEGDTGFTIALPGTGKSQIPLPATKRLLAMPEFAGYTLDPVFSEVCFRRPLNGLAYETTGLLKISTRVTSDRYGTVVRGVDLYKDFKVQVVGPPRPFDQVSMLVENPESLLGSTISDANDRIKSAYERIKNFAEVVLPEAKKAVSDAGGNAAVEGKISALENKLKPWVPSSLDKLPGDDSVWAHYFKEPVLLLSLKDLPKLEELNLRPALTASRDALKAAEDEIDKRRDELKAVKSKEEGERAAAALIDAIDATATKYHDRLEIYRKFQALFFEKSGDAYRLWQDSFIPKLDPERWKKKATFLVDSQQAFDDLYSRLGSRINGVVFATCALSIPSAWKGKAVVAATGSIELKDVTIADRTRDQLTVIGFTSIKVEGTKCDVAVIAGPVAEVSIAAATKFVGQLVFAGSVKRPGDLKGELLRSRFLFTGNSEDSPPKLDHMIVSLSPQVRFRGVVRK